MANSTQPGPLCGFSKPHAIDSGTNIRRRSHPPGPTSNGVGAFITDYFRRLRDLKDACAAMPAYASESIVRHVGQEFRSLIDGILTGLLIALGAMISTTLIGTLIGGGIGSLAGGVGAVPGAVAGAEVGFAVGNWIMSALGVAFLAVYVVANYSQMDAHFKQGVQTAWEAKGDPSAIDRAAREFGEGVGIFFLLLLQAMILYICKAASEGRLAAALGELKSSRLFQKTGLGPWLIENFPRLRAKYTKLRWTVLEEGPAIQGTSIPKWLDIRVHTRRFRVERNEFAKDKFGEFIGPAMKHVGDEAEKANAWAKLAQTDFPISSLAAALEQAESQLMFQPPSKRAKPLKIDNWEFIIDTTGPVWKVFHAMYTSRPRW